MGTFALRFSPTEITELAARYAYEDDDDARRAGASAAARGYYTRDAFVTVCSWKTDRSAPLVEGNSTELVEAATRASFAAGGDETDRMESLVTLEGVGVPTASALLHFAFPGDYPILDVRALASLGHKGRSVYPVSFWIRYLEACRRLAAEHGVSIRELDKALWQWSKENGDG
jgi:hypothetical protein